MRIRKDYMPIVVYLFIAGLVILFNLAWIGTLIWALIYVVTHIGVWFG